MPLEAHLSSGWGKKEISTPLYLEGMVDGQKTPRGHPNLNSYMKILCVFITDRQTDIQTDRQRN
jgi:hypothetical protein